LHKELNEIDRHSKRHLDGKISLGDEEVFLSDVDKRLLMYRNMRLKLLEELEINKFAADKARMDEINRKIAALEKA